MNSVLKQLVGTWESVEAKGKYPTIKDFNYDEKLVFEELNPNLLSYRSTTSINSKIMHCENGFIRTNPVNNAIYLLEAHNFGLSVVQEGVVRENKIVVESTSLSRISTAKEPHVTKLGKSIELLNDNQLLITVDMATSNTEMTNHLIVRYRKQNI